VRRKKLNKEFLSDLIVGSTNEEMFSEILNTEEVKSLMYHQWKNPHEANASAKADFQELFAKIRKRTHPENAVKSPGTQYLIHEIDDLKMINRRLSAKFRISIGIAAAIILLMTLGAVSVINSRKIFQKTYTENIAPPGHKSHVVLPDGSRVILNSGTILRYDNLFGKKYRTIEMAGEAFFEVKKNEKLPFVIATEDITVEVVGTKFNVMAYPDDEYVETTVVEGKVSVTEKHNQSSLMLSANQSATYHKNSKLLLLDDVNPDPNISWKEDILTFDNENFSNVIKKLERWYNVSIHVEGKDSITDRYTITIKRESLREVLDLISLTTNIDYEIKENNVIISYK
jgi:ferric-dicitrate binding protein FerR (iron transport regulator)